MLKIGIIGIPCTGKTTLAIGLYDHYKNYGDRIELVPEFAREYIEDYGFPENLAEQAIISKTQQTWEDDYGCHSAGIQITESPIPLGLLYADDLIREGNDCIQVHLNLQNERDQKNYSYIWNLALESKYDIIFYLPTAIPLVKDCVRPEIHFDPEWRRRQETCLSVLFTNIFVPKRFVEIKSVALTDRVSECVAEITKFEKEGNC